jgi:hypothetical protein
VGLEARGAKEAVPTEVGKEAKEALAAKEAVAAKTAGAAG